jgi:hypothetical protein
MFRLAPLLLIACVHDIQPGGLRDRCAGQVLKLGAEVTYSERSPGKRYEAAELAPARRIANGIYETLPAGTRLELVHCEPFYATEGVPSDDRAWAFAISQDAAGRELLFRALVGHSPDGHTDFLDETGKPVGAQLLQAPQLTWNTQRFNEIQNSVRLDREGNPSFDLSQTVPNPGF